MKNFKERWQIEKNWQLIFPFLGIIALSFSGYIVAKKIISFFLLDQSFLQTIILILISIIASVLFLWITLKLFKVLRKKWDVNYRWELIAIFIAFALTGSSAARLSAPILNLIGLTEANLNGWIYWPLRIILIFPVYQFLLLIFGWIFGQFEFFWNFEKKMLSRLGFARLFADKK